MRGFLRFLAWLSVFIPAAIILGWGAVFLRACFIALTSGGSPVVYRYDSPGGILTARADSYRWSIPRNTLQLEGVTVKDPDGQDLVRAGEILLDDFVPGRKPVRVRLRDAFLRLERKADGKLRLLDWAEPPTPEESEVAYSVVAERVSVLWEDYAGTRPWKRWVSTNYLRVDGRGTEWVASSRLKIERSGFVDVRLNADPNQGFEADLQMDDLELVELLRRFAEMPESKEFPELRDLKLASGVVSGRLRVIAPLEDSMQLLGRVTGEARSLRYGPDLAADFATLNGTLTTEGLRGRATFRDRELNGTFVGVVRWDPALTLAGEVTAQAPRSQSLPKLLRDTLPDGLALERIAYAGWLDFRDATGWSTVGDVRADSLRFGEERAQNVASVLSYQRDQLRLAALEGRYAGSPLSGDLQVDLRSQMIRGHLTTARLDLSGFAKRLGLVAMEGLADAQVAITGTLKSPSAELRATGQATSRERGYEARLGRFDLAANLNSNRINVDRLTLVGPSGTAYAKGVLDLLRETLAFDVLATSVPLGNFFEAIEASAAFSGTVNGTFQNPIARGQLEVFGAQAAGQSIPYARGDVVVDAKGLQAEQVLAFKRGATARGNFGITFGNEALNGRFTTTGINLADYPPEGISGVARVNEAVLSGTLNSPILNAEVEADTLVVANVRFGQVTAQTRIQDRKLFIERAEAKSESGELAGSGVFSLDDESGTFDVEARQFAIAQLVRDAGLDATITGLLDGRAQGSFALGTVQSFAADGQLSALRVNQAFLGNGPVTLNAKDGRWNGSLFLGDLNSYVEIPDLTYDETTKQLDGDVIANNFDASLLYKAIEPYMVNPQGESRLPVDVSEKLAGSTGELDLSVHLSGPVDNLNVDVETLVLSQLTFEGQAAGELTAKGRRENRVWTIDQFQWLGGPASLKLNRARIEEDGQIDVDGEIDDLRWSWLAPLNPAFAKFRGESDVPFLITGQTRSPEIQASLSYDESPPDTAVTLWRGTTLQVRDPRSRARRIDLDTISIRDGEISALGGYNVDGFTGPIEARIPFNYPFEIPADQEIWAKVLLPERPLNSLTDFLPGLDVGRTEGFVRGAVEVRGLKDDLKVTGLAEAQAKQFAWTGIATTLQNFSLTTSFNGESVALDAKAQGSDGGSFAIEEAGFKLGNLADVLSSTMDTLLDNQVFGILKLNDLRMIYQDPQEGTMTGTVGGSLVVNGALRSPLIAGQLLVSGINAAPPSTLTETTGAVTLPIDPRFDVSFLATDSMRLRLSTGSFFLGGDGRLAGSLSSPDFTSTLVVERGSIRLPNARINIEPGGEIAITYRPGTNGTAAARAEINMVGRTQVSAESFTGNVERYDVILNITGDLLQENGLQLTAQSDPPDLSQDRILTILGQGDVLGSRGQGFRADRQLQSALIGIALPYVAGSITERLAEQLGLDYLNVEYNTFDQLSVTAAISLGRDIVLSARRQISEPLPGMRAKFDLRLSYRPPFKNRALRRFSFSIGLDQDRPWKIMIEYGFRF